MQLEQPAPAEGREDPGQLADGQRAPGGDVDPVDRQRQLDQVGSALGLPLWTQGISPFKLVGAPLATGIGGHDLALLLALAIAGLGSSILLIQRRDVG